MDKSLSFFAGLGLGAGLMYMLDPQLGRRRRALARDKAVHFAHEAEEAMEVVGKDMQNRAQGLRAGDFSVLVGGRRGLEHPFSGGWSPSARALMAGMGLGLFVYGLTQSAPMSCFLGTAGCALMAEGVSNVGWEDIAGAAGQVAEQARDAASSTGFMTEADYYPSAEPVAAGR